MDDDFPNDESTTGRFSVDESAIGILNGDLGQLDSDWFRFRMTEGLTYSIFASIPFGSASFSIDIEQLNDDGFVEDRTSRGFFDDETGESAQTHFILFTASRTGDFFVSVNDLAEGEDPAYTLSAREYDAPDFYYTRLNLDDGVAKKSTVDRIGDRDSFLVELDRNATYDFNLRGVDSNRGTLADPILRLYSGFDGLLLTEDSGGQGRDASFRFVAPFTGTFQISAGDAGSSTGTYEIEFASVAGIDDAATGVGTTSRLTMARYQARTLEGSLEVEGDIDWHKVDLVANRWYEFSYTSNDSNSLLFVRDPNGEIPERVSGESGTIYMRAEQSGTHHLVFRNGSEGYTITGVDDAPPEISAKHGHFRLLGDRAINLASLFSIDQFPASHVQVVSEADFYIHDTKYDRFVAHTILPDQIEFVQFRGESKRGEYDVSLRAVGESGVSGWASTVIRSQVDGTEFVDSGSRWDSSNTQQASDNVITYRFADSVPSYFAEGRFTGFAEANTGVRREISSMFGSRDNAAWGANISNITNLRFVQEDSEEADIQIFTADSERYAVGYKPGKNGFGDIVLDNDIYSDAASQPNFLEGREVYELQRAVLTSLGVKHFAPELTLYESMVGNSSGIDADVYPQSFGYWDVEFLQKTYGSGSHPDGFVSLESLGDSSGVDYIRTINRDVPGSIFALQSSVASVLDLRPGHVSQTTDLSLGDQTYVMGEGVYLFRAIGSQAGDVIFGHHGNNELTGGIGDDTLHGLGGDDVLIGGHNDDTYVYETGDGNDLIRELGSRIDGSGGTDTLLIRGKFGFDRLEDDLTIQRLGNDLLINLATNGNYNLNEGSILIKNMSVESERVEKLDLRNFVSDIGVISLPSLFNAATIDQQRFSTNGTTDAYGLVAIPV